MSDGVLIRDGFTLDGHLKSRPGVHGPVSFQYRPVGPHDFYDYQSADKTTGRRRLDATIKVLLKYLVSWDVTEKKPGQDEPVKVPITKEMLERTNPWVLERLSDILLGYVQSDQFGEDLKNSETE